MEQSALHFHGPFSFNKTTNSLFTSPFAKSEGIYIWAIHNLNNQNNFIHYIGETTSFAKRHREHFTNILGLNYYVINPEEAKKGFHNIIWPGMWRDKSTDAVQRTLKASGQFQTLVKDYIEIIDIYFAPTEFESRIRRHVEGCIGWNLRHLHPELTTFYPDDNRVTRLKKHIGATLRIASDQPILGLEDRLEI